MATTGTKSVRDILTDACHEAGVTEIDGVPTAEMADLALRQLNRLMKSWQAREESIDFLRSSMSVAATATATQTLSPVRPIWINSVRFKQGTSEIPMQSMTREEYDDLPVKSSTGVPTCYYYDRQKEAAVFYVWPVLATASGETFEITYQREFEDLDLNDNIDLPGEWWDAAVFGTAYRLDRALSLGSQTLAVDAAEAYQNAIAGQNYGSIWFGDY